MSITNTTYHGYTLITAPKIDTDLLWTLTVVFVGLALIYFFSVFFFRNRISSRSAITKQRKKELAPMISEFLFYEDNVDKAEKSQYIDLKIQIRELLKSDFNRKVLTEILLDLRKDVSGDTQVRLFELYQDLGLEKDAFEKLQSWRWEVISKGISHLTQMRVASAYSFITKFINHRKSAIRKQAEIAIVTLKAEGINYFLDTTRYKISEWQQVKLLEVIQNQKDLDPPRFKMWLTSANKHVVLFALRLIKYYNQNDANSALIELVKHKNNQIKAEALKCIEEFNVVEGLPTLKQVFFKCNVDIKIGILGAIGNLGSASDVPFLKEMAQREGNFSVKSKALSAVNMILPDSIMPTKGIENIGKYVAPETAFDKNEEVISGDALEISNEETFLGNQEIHSVELPDELVESEKPEQQEANLNLDDLIGETKTIENDVANSLDVDYYEVVAPNTSSIPSHIKNKEEQEANEEKSFNAHDKTENITTAKIDSVSMERLEITNIDLDSSAQEIASPLHESDPKSAEESPNNENKEISNDLKNLNFFHFDFIPIVTSNKPNPTLEKYRPMTNAENPELELHNIEVDFEEIVPLNTNIEPNSDTGNFDISGINFLPVVVDTDDNNQEVQSSCSNEIIEISPREMEVFYEEIQGLPEDNELHSLISEINELNFLPIVTDDELNIESKSEDVIKVEASDNLNKIEGFTLSDFEVNFQETPTPDKEETVGLNLENSPIIDAQDPAVDDITSWLMAHHELREIELQYEIVSADNERNAITDLLPEPIYYDEHEAYMMGLLDDLEELGDLREVPFLEELLAVETKSFIKDRITNLITRFSKQIDDRITIKKNFEEHAELPKFSVFADLFKNIDTESKLILLNEIVAVGDEKEIPFLDGLLEDPHLGIRKKAQESLKLLITKISGTATKDENKNKLDIEELPTRLFDVHTPNKTAKNEKNEVNDNLILANTEIQSDVKSEIFEIDFELSEVLDKGHSKNILDLPVIATEISPDGASFLFQLYNFLKIVSIN